MRKISGRVPAGLVMAIVVAVLLTACSPAKDAQTTPEASPSEPVEPAPPPAEPVVDKTVTITDRGFEPAELAVPSGTKVTWTNAGSIGHAVVFLIDSRTLGTIEPGKTSAAVRFSTPGQYQYMDPYHEDLKGVVIVQ